MKTVLSLLLLLGLQGLALAQDGSGEEPATLTFAASVRLPNETFDAEMSNQLSNEFISFADVFEAQAKAEFEDGLTEKGYTFNNVSIKVTNLTDGSVVVAFIITVGGTTINAAQLLDVAETITADSALGTFTADQIRDLDECAETSVTCEAFASCANSIGSFSCECDADLYDESGNGTICVSPVEVLCEPDKIEISIVKAYLDSLSVELGDLRLENETCGGAENTTSGQYTFTILSNIASCGSEITDNATHITYSNELSNKAKSDAVIITGTDISIPFSCSYPVNLNTSLDPFRGEVASINITGPNGTGEFTVELVLYETRSFSVRQTKTNFTTTENLYIQGELDASDPNLAVVFDRCWATPSSAINDSTSYDIIDNGCEISGAVDGTVGMIRNGESGSGQFSVQVFKFVDEDTTYIHCSVSVCSLADGGTCAPDCSAGSRRRRDLRHQSVTLSRAKRDTVKEEEDTVGPFYRVEVEVTGVDVLFWAVVMSLVFIILVLLAIIAYLAVRRRQDEESVRTLKVTPFGQDNCSYTY